VLKASWLDLGGEILTWAGTRVAEDEGEAGGLGGGTCTQNEYWKEENAV